mmetsp:Transcript_10989/g.12360  ORF Transcript_10989/g.12360 Transcript_10989/m.12360 type:complete len:92 (+) Transcript_10989:483-758(+)
MSKKQTTPIPSATVREPIRYEMTSEAEEAEEKDNYNLDCLNDEQGNTPNDVAAQDNAHIQVHVKPKERIAFEYEENSKESHRNTSIDLFRP